MKRSTWRVLALCLVGGTLAGLGFHGSSVIADSFTDVPPSNTFANDIDWLTDYDIAEGFPTGEFRPREAVKRQQAAQWFRRFSSEFELVTDTIDPPAGADFRIDVFCPSDKRALAVTGHAGSGNIFVVDTGVSAISGFIKWRSASMVQDPVSISATVLCAPRL